ncbi:MAG TPA: aldo/keto reductase [Verrucomicrobiae bacterium]|jgi:aryl-alcohol dehydrogenase-like predicted oxidoreductase|nr:aldo/keto reductase [Verrucomicrobiae bacterium]
MEKRKLGNSDLEITPIGLGTWAIGGGGWEFGWGPQDDSDSIAAIREGLDLGINWIDTAAVYGLGHSEEVVAQAIQGRRDRTYVFTKCSMIWDDTRKIDHSLKAASIRHECEQSLRRLRLDAIDLYQVHWPLPDEDIEEAWIELAKLQEQGKVRYIGVSNFDVAQMRRALGIAPITSLQPPYSLLARQAEGDVLPFALQNNIGVIAYSPLYSGLLSGKMTRERVARFPEDDWRKNNRNFKEPLLSRNLRLAKRLGEIGRRHGFTAGEVAISWTLSNPAVTGSIVGVRKPQQVADVLGSAEYRLSASELLEIAQAQEVEAEELSLWAS